MLINEMIAIGVPIELHSTDDSAVEDEITDTQKVFKARINASHLLYSSLPIDDNNHNQNSCYKGYLKLVDAWFTYEALLHLADDHKYTSLSSSKPERLLKSIITDDEISKIIEPFDNVINTLISNKQYRPRLIDYIRLLKNNKGTSKNQLKHLTSFEKQIEKSDDLYKTNNYSVILSLAYAIRNAYAHGEETARAGTKHYKSKSILLQALHEFMLAFILHVADKIYEELLSWIS